ncbi:MAG: hypothetical protein JWM49_1546 [Microbacteriaceae bacterium]|jgi:hypothetical protein|nr:hypothetical protein [Microbacteriaceae bacterium]
MSEYNPPEHPANDASTSVNAAPAAPQQVTTAFWLYIATAAISLVSLIVGLVTIGSSRAEIQRQMQAQGLQLSDSAINASVAVGIAITVIVGILYIGAYVLFAYFMRRGANWARIVLLIITVLSVFGILGAYGLGAVRAVLAIIATVLIFLKPANDYFREVSARKVR